jgi:MGT family glycosyltransferase
MAKILFFNIPAHGHVNPTLPVVAELLQRGHQVIYYDAETLEGAIKGTGAEFRPYPDSSSSEADFASRVNDLPTIDMWVLEESIRLMPFVLGEIDREKPDRVAFDTIAAWGMLAARLRKVPSVSSFSILAYELNSGPFTLRDYLYVFRQGLSKMQRLRGLRRQLVKTYGPEIYPSTANLPGKGDLNIVYTSREFHPDTRCIDDSFHFVGPSFLSATRKKIDFPWESLDPERIKIYISLGTIYNQKIELYRALLATYADHPAQFILSTGHKVEIPDLGRPPDNFIVRNTVPQLELLPKVDLFVTHGGMNSVSEALNCGVPMVVIPQQVEQAINGRQVARKGAGLCLADRPPYGKVDIRGIKRAVDVILEDIGYFRKNAQGLARSFHEAGGYQRAADLIAALGEHNPDELPAQTADTSRMTSTRSTPLYLADSP